jgi:hypothetical protein
MSSSFFQVADVQRILTRYGMTTYLALGDLGLLLNIAIFSQVAHRRNSCSIYILATSLCSFVGLNSSVIPTIYALDNRSSTEDSLLFCKMYFYLCHVLSQMMRTFIVLACVDRYASCSDRARIRLFSQYRTTIRIVPAVVFFWLLVGPFPSLLQTSQNGSCDVFDYTQFVIYSVYIIFALGIIPLAGMITFGSLLLIKLRKMRARVQPIPNTGHSTSAKVLRKRDREMIRMLSIEIIAYTITTTPITIVLIYRAATLTLVKSVERQQIEIFISYFTREFLLYFNNSLPFWIYITTSRSFRRELKNVLIKWFGYITCKRT